MADGIGVAGEAERLPEPRKVIHPPPPTVEYLYGRIQLRGLGDMVLGGQEAVREDTITFKRYAASRADGLDFATKLLTLGHEIVRLAENTREFVKTYESKKWED